MSIASRKPFQAPSRYRLINSRGNRPILYPALPHQAASDVTRRQAIRHGKTRKDPWPMAKTIASGVGMTNAWLQSQGLISLKSLWAKLAPLRRTA